MTMIISTLVALLSAIVAYLIGREIRIMGAKVKSQAEEIYKLQEKLRNMERPAGLPTRSGVPRKKQIYKIYIDT